MPSPHAHRKDEHVSLAEKFYSETATSQFDQVRFIHQSLPESSFDDPDLTTTLGPLTLDTPLLINAMTGGSDRTGKLNASLGRIAAATGVAVASGSMSLALKEPQTQATFTPLRTENTTGLVFANLGAGASVADAKQAVALLQADALQLHVNSLQELIMPEGDRTFHWLTTIEAIIAALDVPVIVKEVGFGMAQETLTQLAEIGATVVDVGGRGGTNFATIENFRRPQKDLAYLADWGQTTVESLLEAHAVPELEVIATGGIRTPLDIAKALALGAQVVGIAGTVLHHLIHEGEAATVQLITDWLTGLRRIMTLLGIDDIASFAHQPLILSPDLLSYCQQRGLA